MVSPVICPPVEDTPGPTTLDADGRFTALGTPDDIPSGALTLNVVRDELTRIVTARSVHDANLHYLDGRDLFGPDDIPDLPDGLHPNIAGHRRIAERFADFAFTHPGPFA